MIDSQTATAPRVRNTPARAAAQAPYARPVDARTGPARARRGNADAGAGVAPGEASAADLLRTLYTLAGGALGPPAYSAEPPVFGEWGGAPPAYEDSELEARVPHHAAMRTYVLDLARAAQVGTEPHVLAAETTRGNMVRLFEDPAQAGRAGLDRPDATVAFQHALENMVRAEVNGLSREGLLILSDSLRSVQPAVANRLPDIHAITRAAIASLYARSSIADVTQIAQGARIDQIAGYDKLGTSFSDQDAHSFAVRMVCLAHARGIGPAQACENIAQALPRETLARLRTRLQSAMTSAESRMPPHLSLQEMGRTMNRLPTQRLADGVGGIYFGIWSLGVDGVTHAVCRNMVAAIDAVLRPAVPTFQEAAFIPGNERQNPDPEEVERRRLDPPPYTPRDPAIPAPDLSLPPVDIPFGKDIPRSE